MSIPNDLSDTGSALYPYEQYALEVIGTGTVATPAFGGDERKASDPAKLRTSMLELRPPHGSETYAR